MPPGGERLGFHVRRRWGARLRFRLGARSSRNAGELTLRLVKDDVPIQGRVLDLQGKPVAGVMVRIDPELFVPTKGDLTDWLQALNVNKQAQKPTNTAEFTQLYSPALAMLFAPVTTGPDGGFTLTGIGRERVASLHAEGATICNAAVQGHARHAESIRLADEGSGLSDPPVTCHGATFDLL